MLARHLPIADFAIHRQLLSVLFLLFRVVRANALRPNKSRWVPSRQSASHNRIRVLPRESVHRILIFRRFSHAKESSSRHRGRHIRFANATIPPRSNRWLVPICRVPCRENNSLLPRVNAVGLGRLPQSIGWQEKCRTHRRVPRPNDAKPISHQTWHCARFLSACRRQEVHATARVPPMSANRHAPQTVLSQ